MWRLFFPLRYFALINSEKRHLDLWPTLLLTAVLATPFIAIPGASFFQSGGFLDKLLVLTSALTGFYVAALVAAATFPRGDLDKPITLGAISLPMKIDGEKVVANLTRREFACTIFGYLAFSAMMISIFGGLFVALGPVSTKAVRSLPWVGHLMTGYRYEALRGVFVVAFCVAISHLAVVTSLGLYYLMDRLNRRDPEVLGEKTPSKRAA